jgi:phospholipase/carboxylesterase/glyoxalase family protein
MASVDTTGLGFRHVCEPGTSGWTILALHGTGGDEHDLLGLAHQLAPGAAVLSPRGNVLENGMPRFFARLAIGQLDIPDLLVRTDELVAFVTGAASAYELDPSRIVAVGLSNGANIATSVLLRHPGLLRGAALLRPMLPYEPETPPALTGTDVLIAAGEGDPFSSPQQTARLEEILTGAGATVQLTVEPGAGHNLTLGDLRRAAAWAQALTQARS